MKMLGATAAALLFAATALAVPAGAQSLRAAPGAGAFQSPGQAGATMRARPGSPGNRTPIFDGRWERDEPRPPCFRKGRCGYWGLYGYGYGYGYGGLGHQDMIAGGRYGYFSQGGHAPRTANGRATFDYDRGYPYEYYGESDRSDRSDGRGTRYARSRDCSIESTRDRRTGRAVEIRVCRN